MLDAVIVGGGVAAHRAAIELAKAEGKFRITVISDEAELPYDRPALSKQHLQDQDRSVTLGGTQIYGDAVRRIHARAEELDNIAYRLRLDSGQSIAYDRLLLATGSRLRRFPGADSQGVLYLRTMQDAARLLQFLRPGVRIGIVGGGFVGLEIAAAAHERGARPIVIEASRSLLGRVGSSALSHWAERIHSSNEVEILLNSKIEELRRSSDGSYRFSLGEREVVVDCVVVGIGITPNTDLAKQASLVVNDGIMVDRQCITSDQSIWSAGEVTRYPARFISRHIRSESWTSSGEQGATAGRVMAGDEAAAFEDCPWLWSDQYLHNIQSLGLPSESARRVIFGDQRSDKWLELGYDDRDQFVGAVGVNVGRHFTAIRRALRAQKPLPDGFLDLERA
jgi:NADPH-dependent 2,4-dienoyl-CoA reductase/sulfur reductase-like enzyme